LNKLKINFYFLTATIFFSLSAPILKFLIEQGSRLGFTHPDAVSFCNVLFIGNLCAGLATYFYYQKHSFSQEMKGFKLNSWILLLVSALVAILYPSLIFIALEETTVTHLVLLSRFEGIIYAFLIWIFIRQKPSMGSFISYLVIASGILIAMVTDNIMSDKATLLLLQGSRIKI